MLFAFLSPGGSAYIERPEIGQMLLAGSVGWNSLSPCRDAHLIAPKGAMLPALYTGLRNWHGHRRHDRRDGGRRYFFSVIAVISLSLCWSKAAGHPERALKIRKSNCPIRTTRPIGNNLTPSQTRGSKLVCRMGWSESAFSCEGRTISAWLLSDQRAGRCLALFGGDTARGLRLAVTSPPRTRTCLATGPEGVYHLGSGREQ